MAARIARRPPRMVGRAPPLRLWSSTTILALIAGRPRRDNEADHVEFHRRQQSNSGVSAIRLPNSAPERRCGYRRPQRFGAVHLECEPDLEGPKAAGKIGPEIAGPGRAGGQTRVPFSNRRAKRQMYAMQHARRAPNVTRRRKSAWPHLWKCEGQRVRAHPSLSRGAKIGRRPPGRRQAPSTWKQRRSRRQMPARVSRLSMAPRVHGAGRFPPPGTA